MEELLAAHRKQQRDLQSQITQKKKSASKKTRKGVNDECARLEEDLKTRQQAEIDAFNGSTEGSDTNGSKPDQAVPDVADGNSNDDDLLAAIVNSSTSSPPLSLTAKTSTTNLDDNDESDATQSTSRKPNRQKARLARRAAEQEAAAAQAAAEASNLPDLKQRERTRMLEEFGKRGLKEKEVAANGHCLYSAVADQMRQLNITLSQETSEHEDEDQDETKELRNNDYKRIRQAAAIYISSNADDFAPFLEEPLEEYVRKIRETGEWGGQLELMALAKTYGININVLQGDGRVEKIEGAEEGKKDVPAAWLAYYKHGFGLGEHYNSLRRS